MPSAVLDFSDRFGAAGVRAVFTTRHFPYDSRQDRTALARTLGLDPDRLVIPGQTHSSHVRIVDSPGIFEDTDGVVTRNPDLVLSIQVADCIPVFLVDRPSGTIGIVHAGWRGIVAGIIPNAVHTMCKIGADPASLQLLMGPSIRQCCFEVRDDVLPLFQDRYIHTAQDNRHFIDLQRLVSDQALGLGIAAVRIIDQNVCTMCHPEEFHSYRRSGKTAGRMLGFLTLEPKWQ